MKSRLKRVIEANKYIEAADDANHDVVEKSVIDPNFSKDQAYNQAFAAAETILSRLPVAPTSFLLNQITQLINAGQYQDICNLDEFDSHIDEFVQRTVDILRASGNLS